MPVVTVSNSLLQLSLECKSFVSLLLSVLFLLFVDDMPLLYIPDHQNVRNRKQRNDVMSSIATTIKVRRTEQERYRKRKQPIKHHTSAAYYKLIKHHTSAPYYIRIRIQSTALLTLYYSIPLRPIPYLTPGNETLYKILPPLPNSSMSYQMPSYNGQQATITIIFGQKNPTPTNAENYIDIEMSGCNEIHNASTTMMSDSLEEIQQRWQEEVRKFEMEIQNEEELDIVPRVARRMFEARSMEYVEELRRKEKQYCVEMNEVEGMIEKLRQRVEKEKRRIRSQIADGVLEHEIDISVVLLATMHLG